MMKTQHNGGWMVSTFAIVIVLIMSVTILAISTRVILSLNRGIESYSERQAYWNAHSAVSVWESTLQFEATTTYNSVNGWDRGEIIIDSTGMKGIGKTGSDSNIVWIVELDEREEQDGGGDADPGTVYTFTNCGQEGRSGPSQEQCNDEYGEGIVTVINGIQGWIVPENGTYNIEAWGASGGGDHGGKGVKISADFTLDQGDVILILVGQQGATSSPMSSGGGGTFVVKQSGFLHFLNTHSVFVEPLIIAGGGGGSSNSPITTQNGTTLTSGQTGYGGWKSPQSGGINGSGGGGTGGSGGGGGGGGFSGNGTGYSPGMSFLNGGKGGVRAGGASTHIDGSFGGGGGSRNNNNNYYGGGAGGGYSGGGGACKGNTQPRFERGGGGGSYCGDQSGGECVENVNATGDGGTWERNDSYGKVIITVMD